MNRAFRPHRIESRHTDRIPLHARLFLTTLDGKPAAPLARCTNIGLGGMRVEACEGLPPGTPVRIELRLPSGRIFSSLGQIAWLTQTMHPALLGSPRGREDDAAFGIAFTHASTDDLLPIARLFLARDQERRRAGKIARLHRVAFHA